MYNAQRTRTTRANNTHPEPGHRNAHNRYSSTLNPHCITRDSADTCADATNSLEQNPAMNASTSSTNQRNGLFKLSPILKPLEYNA